MADKKDKVELDGVEGVWRTIGGRRVFIRTGQSLGDAMRESGKFKKKDIDKTDKEYIKRVANAKDEEDLKKADEYYKEKTALDKEKREDLLQKVLSTDVKKINNQEVATAEDVFLARIKSGYNNKTTKQEQADYIDKIRKTNIVAKTDNYLLHTIKEDDDYVYSNITTSYRKNSRFNTPPDIDYETDNKNVITKVRVNWGAYGSVDVSEAEDFAKQMKDAIDFAKKIKGKKIK